MPSGVIIMSSTNTLAPTTDPRYIPDDPADRAVTFVHDLMHFPLPVSPLFQSLHPGGFSAGIVAAAQELQLPIAGYDYCYRNNYQFERPVFAEPASEDEAKRMEALAEAAMNAQFPIMRARWEEEHRPRLEALLRRLDQISEADPVSLGPETVDDLCDIHREFWTIHFRIVHPQLLIRQIFDEFYADVMGPEHDSYPLQGGGMNKTIEAGIGLSDLAARARELGLSTLLTDNPPEAVFEQLPKSEAGRIFRAQLDAYLDAFGYQQERLDFDSPTLKEQPEQLVAALQAYLQSGQDNRAEHEARVREAEAATAEARAILRSYPEPVRQQFESLLPLARDSNFLHEEHNYYIDQQGLSRIRLAFLTIGRALVDRGAFDQPDDVFMLHLDEVKSALAGAASNLRPTVAERRISMEASRNEMPPPFVGAPPAGPPPDSLAVRARARFFGTIPPPSTDPALVMGTGGSPGSVTAPAFVARTLEDATGIPVGHVLVTMTTTPQWTPLFGVASAIVTEAGGPLSHSAIVAREYAIPAVVGAMGATRRIATGDMVTVDGTNGTVRLDG